MFDIGWGELILIAMVAVIVIGPKDLPYTIRTITTFLERLRGFARDFFDSLNQIAEDEEIASMRDQLRNIHFDMRSALERKMMTPELAEQLRASFENTPPIATAAAAKRIADMKKKQAQLKKKPKRSAKRS